MIAPRTRSTSRQCGQPCKNANALLDCRSPPIPPSRSENAMNIATSTFLAGAFAVGTAMFWGTYGPLLQKGHHLMGSGRLRPFICVGIAYLLVAIVGPIVVMYLTGMEMDTAKGKGLSHGWTVNGIIWSTIAGGVGALGAFTLIMAINYGGKASPIYVMP